MNISRFFGSTNREALRQVRLALGPEALIVSNRRVNGGVEILATDPTSAATLAQAGTDVGIDTGPSAPAAARPPQRPMHTPAPPAAGQDAIVMSAIGEMRGALETRIDELMWGNQLRGAPQAAALFQSLLSLGFSTALLRAMLKRLPATLSGRAAMQWARNELVTHLPVMDSEDTLWRPGLALALVGPTGVGKTTTIAKLAARCVRRAGPDKLVLVTTDTYRIGAHEQLKIYGQMLRVPVHVVQDVEELRRIAAGLRPDQTLLVDNVGISQRDRYIAEQAAMLAGAGRPVGRLLVLNASSHGDTLDEVARCYANDGGTPLKGCIITKVDEASRLGAALDTAIRYQLPIHYVSNGQKVPENLVLAEAADLVDQALVQDHQKRALYAPTEADFAALMSLSKPVPDDSDAAAAEGRRQRLLPRLLSMASQAGAPLSMDDLKAACGCIDDDPAISEAYDLWRGHTAAKSDATALKTTIDHMLRVARHEAGQGGSGHVLAVHDHVGTAVQPGLRGKLRATLVFSDKAQALTSPMQQLVSAEGWLSSCGATAQVAPSPADALLHQVQWLGQHAAGLSAVHLVEGGTLSLWRSLSAMRASWLAQCPAGTRVRVDDCPTTVGAVAKTLTYRPLDEAQLLPGLSQLAGVPVEDVMVWTAAGMVEVAARQHDALPLQLACLRIVKRADGSVLRTVYGLSNISPSTITPDRLSAWLLARGEIKTALRYAAEAWQALAEVRDDAGSRQKRALVAVQAGMAAWQLKQSPVATPARRVAASLVNRPGLPAATPAPALMKLFALKEMVEA
ncbi:flagellar biosynthesis protein FlhF [Parapusillimonas sp. SGNA-6]|nr:flagellar biosynthesis protein FlhF [Parapusillimonas sp. SGNA-6]